MRAHNHKGSPQRLGKPDLGESRHPTAFESEYCGLRRSDLICVNSDGAVYILRCAERYRAGTKRVLYGRDARDIVRDLEECWSR